MVVEWLATSPDASLPAAEFHHVPTDRLAVDGFEESAEASHGERTRRERQAD